ncbi:toxin [Enterococcus faecalis]|nr:toxin [Enterococcus faecalis]
MNDYELLVDTLSDEVPIKEVPLYEVTKDTAYFYKGTIFIEKNLSTIEKKERLYEEYGHYKTSVGNILSQNIFDNRKQEKKAHIYGTTQAISLDDLVEAWKVGCRYYWECAEFLGFTTQYVIEAVQHIKESYGLHFTYKNFEFKFITDSCIEITK